MAPTSTLKWTHRQTLRRTPDQALHVVEGRFSQAAAVRAQMRAGIETHPFTLWPAQQIDGQVGVDEVATAVPAFVGYTEKAEDGGKPLVNAGGTPKPWRISSMAEFHQYFGYAPRVLFELKEAKTDNSDASFRVGAERKGYLLERAAGRFNLYRGNA